MATAEEPLLIEIGLTDNATQPLNNLKGSIEKFGGSTEKAMLRSKRQISGLDDSLTKFSRMGTRQIRTFDNAVTALLRKAPIAIGLDLAARIIGFGNAFEFLNKILDQSARGFTQIGRAIANIVTPNLIEANSGMEKFNETLDKMAQRSQKQQLIPFTQFEEGRIDVGPFEGSAAAIEAVRTSVNRGAEDYEKLTNAVGKAAAELVLFGKTDINMDDIRAELELFGANMEGVLGTANKAQAEYTQALLIAKRLNAETKGLVVESDNQVRRVKGFVVQYDQLGKLAIKPVFTTLVKDVNRAKQIVKELDTADFKKVFEIPQAARLPLVQLTTDGVSLKTVYKQAAGDVLKLENEVEGLRKKIAELKDLQGPFQLIFGVPPAAEAALKDAEDRLAALKRQQPAESILNTTEESLNALSFGMEEFRLQAELAFDPFDKISAEVSQIKTETEQAKLALVGAFAAGQIDLDQYERLGALLDKIQAKQLQMARTSESFSVGVKRGLEGIRTTGAKLGEMAVGGTFNAFNNFFMNLADSSMKASDTFKTFALDFVRNLAMMGAQILAFQATVATLKFLGITIPAGFAKGGMIQGGMSFAKGGVIPGGLEGIPSYAGGGVVKGATVAQVGDNKERVEAVVPLPGLNRGIPVEFKNGGAGGGVQANVTMNVGSLDPRTAAQVILGASREIEQMIAVSINNGVNRGLRTAVRGG